MPRLTLAGFIFLGASVAPLFAQQTCQGLMSLALDHVTLTSAMAVPEGPVAKRRRGGGDGRGGGAVGHVPQELRRGVRR